jgi:hypothetical protein
MKIVYLYKLLSSSNSAINCFPSASAPPKSAFPVHYVHGYRTPSLFSDAATGVSPPCPQPISSATASQFHDVVLQVQYLDGTFATELELNGLLSISNASMKHLISPAGSRVRCWEAGVVVRCREVTCGSVQGFASHSHGSGGRRIESHLWTAHD